MKKFTLENYRCFADQQTVSLAPLTLLVGPNSTGKTSFLALIRALWDVAFLNNSPNFMEDPYNLGSFQDIVHHLPDSGEEAKEFSAGFEDEYERNKVSFQVTFEERTGTPFPTKRKVSQDGMLFETYLGPGGKHSVHLELGSWVTDHQSDQTGMFSFRDDAGLWPLPAALLTAAQGYQPWFTSPERDEASADPEFQEKVQAVERMEQLLLHFWPGSQHSDRPFASAPIRSRPRRTYDPIRITQDPGGEYIPSYLASLSRRRPTEFAQLKDALESFGKGSGLFEEISVRSPLGDSDGDPFQILIRVPGDDASERPRNLVDVGYGVSQSLPVLTELLTQGAPSTCLLQQPEVHLHPSAQAALGSLFCALASANKQLLVETHSDYLIDRIRMDVRDGASEKPLLPEEVSILYFEPLGTHVKIHSIGIDEVGNVVGAPHSYGSFFMAESRRSIGL